MPRTAHRTSHQAIIDGGQAFVPRVLVVEDEPGTAGGLHLHLTEEGFEVAVAQSGQAALDLHARFKPHLILLDLMLPDMHGLDVLSRIRRADCAVRVVIISCLSEPEQRAAGLLAGANDYQIKPFVLEELRVRVRCQVESVVGAIRRAQPIENLQYKLVSDNADELVLDRDDGVVRFRGHRIELAVKPFTLLCCLADAGGSCVNKEKILRELWHFRHMPNTHTVEQHIAQLRRVLRVDEGAPEVIVTVYGRGYRLNPTIELRNTSGGEARKDLIRS